MYLVEKLLKASRPKHDKNKKDKTKNVTIQKLNQRV